MSLKGNTTAEKIWNFLISKGLNECGAAGLMGNLKAESALNPMNLQQTYERKLGHTDASYTAAVDAGTYTNFVKDSAGYGLAQWTYWSRKEKLLNYARSCKASIGDLETQLCFLWKELSESYGSVLTTLKNAKTIREASDAVLLKYERPANQGTSVQQARAAYGQEFFDQFAAKTNTGKEKRKMFTPRTTKPEAGNKYYIRKASGGWSPAIKGSPTDKDCDVLSNCVGYAVGRFNEIGGYGCCKYLKAVNAENFIQYKDAELEVGQTPKLGACAVWRKGATLSGSDGAGHVAIVEKVISDTEIVTSESGWGSSTPFWTKTRQKGGGNWGAGTGYTFIGFIYNPAPCCQSSGTNTSTGSTNTGTTSGSGNTLKVGDIVTFTGSKHYANANAASGPACKPGKAKITAIYQLGKSKHPYHLVNVSGGGSTVYGWVDVADIKEAATEAPQTPQTWTPKVGDVVNYNGSTHYTSANSSSPKACKGGKAKITQIYQLGKSKHPYHLVRVSGAGATVYGWVDAGTFTKV